METRNIKFTATFSGPEIIENDETNGLFHRWADDPIFLGERYMDRTVGIVETENGQVYKVPAENIRFISLKEQLENYMSDTKV